MSWEDVEAIKQLKARYFRYLDTKQWDKWGGVFTEDAELVNTQSRAVSLQGREEIVRVVSTNLEGVRSVHHGHMPEIELTSPTTATGIWSMEDMLRWPDGSELHGYGHYHETYEKIDGQWRIKTLTLTRLRIDSSNSG